MVSSTSRPHFTPRKDPVPILQEAGWAPGPVWTGGKSLPHRDSIPDRPARSQSLNRLSYRAHIKALMMFRKISNVTFRIVRKTYMRTSIHMHIYVRTYVHTHLHTHTETLTHTQTHTHAHKRVDPPHIRLYVWENFKYRVTKSGSKLPLASEV